MPNVTFKGFRQVTKDYFDNLTDEQKVGYLWFVRSNIDPSGNTYDGDIFLGTRCYGHFGNDVAALEDKLDRILYNAGIVDESGNTINITVDYLTKDDAEDLYVKKTTLFNQQSEENLLGILLIDGNDTGND
jgi:hypothetical protein